MLCPVLLVALLLAHAVRPWMVVAISLVVGVTDALSMPSFQSIVPSIVPRGQIAAGLALNATQFNLSRILGPALAGVLMVSVGAVGCFAVNAASYVPFIMVALWILPRATAHGVRTRIGARLSPARRRARGRPLAATARRPAHGAGDQHAVRTAGHVLAGAGEGPVPRRRGPVQHRRRVVRRRRPARRGRAAVRRRPDRSAPAGVVARGGLRHRHAARRIEPLVHDARRRCWCWPASR